MQCVAYSKLIQNWYNSIEDGNINNFQLFKDTKYVVDYLEQLKEGDSIPQIKVISDEILQKFNEHGIGESELLANLIAYNTRVIGNELKETYQVIHKLFQLIAESYESPKILDEDFDITTSVSPDLLCIINIDAAALNYIKKYETQLNIFQYSKGNIEANITENSSCVAKISHIIKININYLCITNPSRINKELKVRKIKRNERLGILGVTDHWKSIADAKSYEVGLLFPNLIYRDKTNLYLDSSKICNDISLSLLPHRQENDEIYICYSDEENSPEKIEAIALVYKQWSSLYISLLASHPKNLLSPVNISVTNQVSGAATKLINHLKEVVCPELNVTTIRLESLQNAKSFYEKLGFKKYGSGKNKMELTLDPNPQSDL